MLVVGVDFDGVLCDLMTVWLARYNKEYQDNKKKEHILSFRASDYLQCSYKKLKAYRTPDIYEYADDIPGAGFFVDTLQELPDVHVVCISHDTKEYQWHKETWLTRNGFNVPLYLTKGNKWDVDVSDSIYDDPYKKVTIDFLVDDNIKNTPTVLFNQPWNSRRAHNSRANNWYEALQLFLMFRESIVLESL